MLLLLVSPLCVALAVAAFLFLGAPAWSAEGTFPSPAIAGEPAADSVEKARALIREGRFREALVLLQPFARHRPVEPNVLFLFGLAALGASQQPDLAEEARKMFLDGAITAFRTMLIDRPELVRVRLELARAFFYKGEDGLSREHFERVLAGNPPAPVVANVRRFLAQIRARRRWNVQLGFAVAPDTNIGGTSDERIIYIFGLPFRRDAASLTTSGVGLSVWGGGEYQHPLGERVRLRLGMDASRREYSGGKFDQMLVSWHAGPRVFVSRTTEFSVLGNWRHQWTANDPNYFDLGGRLTLNHRFSRRLTASGRASWYDRRYRTRKLLDGPVRNFALSAGWVLTPTVRLNATAGYGRDRPVSLRNRNESFWLQTGVSLALPKGFTVGGGGGVRWTDYEAPWPPHTPADQRRKDTTYNLRLSVFNRALTFFGFSPEVSLIHEVRNTNAQLYDYKRTGGELRVVRQF
ncbi:MAG: surface lipoprotein assembly modifier [Deltaproteobacteria bacterium]|nr:surface lipoprotein assembly modifier [Deltaproteobacteria bacterium]